MKIIETEIPGALVIEPPFFEDDRGFHLVAWASDFFDRLGLDHHFHQESHVRSVPGVLRGLHYQTGHVQGKLIRVVAGEAYDVGVDMRRSSPTYGKWHGEWLSAENKRMYWLPVGFAHGFYIPNGADLLFNLTGPYDPPSEVTLAWDDPEVGIEWPLVDGKPPIVSERDQGGLSFADAAKFD